MTISQTYQEYENREDKFNSIIEINNEELTRRNRHVNEILESLPSYVSWVDNHLNYIGMNKNFEDLVKINKKQLIGKRLGSEKENPNLKFIHFVEDFVKSEKTNDYFEYFDTFHSQKYYLDVYLQRISKSEKIIINSIDVTEKVKLKMQLTKETETKIHKEKLVLLGEMAAGVAHEINNPMTVILGQGQSILKRLKNHAPAMSEEELTELTKRVEKIVSMSNRVTRIFQSLKILSRNTENDDFRIEEIENIINPALDLCNDKLKFYGIDLFLEIPAKTLIKCKSGELTQVLYNLINNSIEAIKDLDEKWIKIVVLLNALHFEIRVIDSGPGIGEDVQNKLFNPFFTTKPVGLGTGLGLSISKKIIENHNGKIFLDKTSPHTCFIISLAF
jgi:signal transduction histidine kinase